MTAYFYIHIYMHILKRENWVSVAEEYKYKILRSESKWISLFMKITMRVIPEKTGFMSAM